MLFIFIHWSYHIILCDFLCVFLQTLQTLHGQTLGKRWQLVEKSRSYMLLYLYACGCISPGTPSLSLEVSVSTTKMCVGVSFTTASFHFPFIASSGDPQDPHLFILAACVALSGHCCGVSALHLPKITWQSNHLATTVTSISSDVLLKKGFLFVKWWTLVQNSGSRKAPVLFDPDELVQLFSY